MGVDFILHYRCRPKEELGNGDVLAGTDRLLAASKARNRAEVIAELCRRDGESPEGKKVVVGLLTANDGTVRENEVTYEQLVEEGQVPTRYESECAACPGNVHGGLLGCMGYLNYPIPQASEQWLMERVQPSGSVGGQLFLRAIRDFGYTGEPIRNFRQGGLFESGRAVKKSLKRGWLAGEAVTSDQLFQAIFCIGEPLNPGHCLGILLWLGCLRLNGSVVATLEQAQAVMQLASPEQRRGEAELDIGTPTDDPALSGMQDLLRALHASWIFDVPLLVSA